MNYLRSRFFNSLGTAIFNVLLAAGTTATADVVLLADDFDGNTVGALNPSGGINLTTVADPAGGSNQVGRIEFTGGGQWQSLLSQHFELPPGTVAGEDDIAMDYRVYIPSSGVATIGTGFGDADSFNSLWRLNGTPPDAYPPSAQNPVHATFPLDQWVTISNGGLIPALDNTDPMPPVTSLQPILSIRDIEPGVAGLFAYVDDVRVAIVDPTDPKLLQIDGGFSFGTLYHESATAETVLTVTYINAQSTQDLTIDSISISDSEDGVFSLVSAPADGTVVAVGQTFDVTVAATGGGGFRTLQGTLSIDVSHGGAPENDQDREDPIVATIATAGDPYYIVENWSLDHDLVGWGGNAAPTDGLLSEYGARIVGRGDDRGNPTENLSSSLEQAFQLPGVSDFDVTLAIAIPDFDDFTQVAGGSAPEFYDRSFNLALLAEGSTLPGEDAFTDELGADAILNLFYMPTGAGSDVGAGFFVYNGALDQFERLSVLGTLQASTDFNSDGTSPNNLNVYRMKIECRDFGTAQAQYSVGLSEANSETISRAATGLTFYRGANPTQRLAGALLLTTHDPHGSETNPADALQASYWVDDVAVSLNTVLPAAFFSYETPLGYPKVVAGTSKAAFSVSGEGLGGTLEVSEVSFGNPNLSLAGPPLPVSIPSGSSVPFWVKVDDSVAPGPVTDTVTLDTSDSLSPLQSAEISLNVFASDSVSLLDYDDGVDNGIHEGSVRNGGFEEGSVGDSVDATPWWTRKEGGNSAEQLTFNSVPATGSLHGRTAGWSGGRDFIPMQAFSPEEWTLEAGDSFDVELKWRAGEGFDPDLDSFNVVMWAVRDDGTPINSPLSARVIQSQNTTTDTTVYQTVTISTDPVPEDSNWIGLGYQFILEIGELGTHFAWIDDVCLIGSFQTGSVTPTGPSITFLDYEPGTQGVTLYWTDEGGDYKVQASDDHDWSMVSEIPLDGSEQTVDGEMQFLFTDPEATGPRRLWRVAE